MFKPTCAAIRIALSLGIDWLNAALIRDIKQKEKHENS